MKIEGATALVTGANRGLGAAFTQMLLERGARTVYAGARNPGDVTNPGVVPVELDITDPDEVAAAAARCQDVTLLINNAVYASQSPLIGSPSLREARREMETNYFGTLAMCRAFAPVLGRNGGGALVNMLSIVSFFNVPAMGSFCPTKAALWSLTNGVRIELRQQGTLVVAVHSGFIDTRLSEGFDVPKHPPADVAAQILDAVESGREEVLADERTRATKAALPNDLELIYPPVERQWAALAAPARPGPGVDATVAHSARIWNYWLGGKDNYAADRQAGDKVAVMLPSIVAQARADRAFLGRAIRYLAGEAGIRQFLDIGAGLPTVDNTHEVAQRVAPQSRIVYADNDPLVLVHARALLTSAPEGACDYIDGDLHDPDKILAEAARTLDFSQPVALMLLGIVHHISDTDEAYSIVRRLVSALAPGSFLAINHSTSAIHGAAMQEAVAHWNQVGTPPMTLRTPPQIARFFDGLDLLAPGVVSCSRWRPDLSLSAGPPGEVDEFCGVARKPSAATPSSSPPPPPA